MNVLMGSIYDKKEVGRTPEGLKQRLLKNSVSPTSSGAGDVKQILTTGLTRNQKAYNSQSVSRLFFSNLSPYHINSAKDLPYGHNYKTSVKPLHQSHSNGVLPQVSDTRKTNSGPVTQLTHNLHYYGVHSRKGVHSQGNSSPMERSLP